MSLMDNRQLLTVVNNLSYYGYVPSIELLRRLLSLSDKELATFWKGVDSALAELTATNRKMDDFVVYKNFPREVLEMSQAQYWGQQILMYWGFDKDLFAQAPAERPALEGLKNRKVLHLAVDDSAQRIWNSLLLNKARWTEPQQATAKFLLTHLNIQHLDVDSISFKENAIQLVSLLLDVNPSASVAVNNATDVLRLAAMRSNADVSLRKPIKFKSFARKERRFFCLLLNNSKHLDNDIAERPELFKLLLRRLHPGDFRNYPQVHQAYHSLYQGKLTTFASQVEAGIKSATPSVLQLLAQRPGDYARRLHKLYDVFGQIAVNGFIPLMEKLSTQQLVKLLRYVDTINQRSMLVYPPKGNWNKLKVVANTKKPFELEAKTALREAGAAVLRARLVKLLPDGVDLDLATDLVKLQTNDQELASYGRGTVFPIPENVTFLRTASYWENKNYGTSWYDNGWNFFSSNWEYKGAVCWNAAAFGKGYDDEYYSRRQKNSGAAAIFSGDPINSKDLKGRACQMIDLYLDRLQKAGIRYAVWNILCFSRRTFAQATGEVVATLQWGEKPDTGRLYEPSRAQLVFPLKGETYTKYIAYIDIEKRQLVYMDANLKGNTGSANMNGLTLSEQMPAFVEYLHSLPSVADLLLHATPGTAAAAPALYTDKDRNIDANQTAYVFKPENNANQFQQLDLSKLLA